MASASKLSASIRSAPLRSSWRRPTSWSVNCAKAGLVLAGVVAFGHEGAEAVEDAGDPAVVPVGGVLGGWAFGQVGVGPELVEPGQFPEGFWVVGPAGSDLAGQVAGVLGAEHG